MTSRRSTLLHAAAVAALLACAPSSLDAESSFGVSRRYTAQRKPRITVLGFENTNAMAQQAGYGSSVEAMLVTFFKRKSQFVVVERQKLGSVLEEWKRNQSGLTNAHASGFGELELLEKLDGIVLGNVTLLDATATATTSSRKGQGERPAETIRDQRIEIDAKLLSRTDARIIAAAQRSGPVRCLRTIVERLGLALEREFLRPYYGKLRFRVTEPENVRIFMTPILLDTALDEEKPPIERGATVVIDQERDTVEPWATDPTSYTIEQILSGYYSLRLERPGYEGIGTENAGWEAREEAGRVVVYDRQSNRPLTHTSPRHARFVVRVDPLATEVVDGDALGFSFRKLGGSIEVRAKREYLDRDFVVPKDLHVTVFGDTGMAINQPGSAGEFADDGTCDLFAETLPPLIRPGTTRIAAGQTFDFALFKGGGLYFEDYRGEMLPVGTYDLQVRAPYHDVGELSATVRDQDRGKPMRTLLRRQTAPLTLARADVRSDASLHLHGQRTGHTHTWPLDSSEPWETRRLAVDEYVAATTVPGLECWSRSVRLLPANALPQITDPDAGASPRLTRTEAESRAPARSGSPAPPARVEPPPTLRVKTGLVIGGREHLLGAALDTRTDDDVRADREISRLLDALLRRTLIATMPSRPSPLGSYPAQQLAARRPDETTSIAEAERRARDSADSNGTAMPRPVRGDATESVRGARAVETPTPLPRDPRELSDALAERLRDVDLLVLDDRDLAELQALGRRTDDRARVATVIRSYVEQGGAVFAFASRGGDYQNVLGVPLKLDLDSKRSDRFELVDGEIKALRFKLPKKVRLASKRSVPRIERGRLSNNWRVAAYAKNAKPRVIEHGHRDHGGYVMLWCDEPGELRGRRGADFDAIRGAWNAIGQRALAWARYLMYRRYDGTGEELKRAKQRLDSTHQALDPAPGRPMATRRR